MESHSWGGSEVLWSEAALRIRTGGHEVMASVARWPELAAPLRELEAEGVRIDARNWIAAGLPQRLLAKLAKIEVVHPGNEPAWQRLKAFGPDLVCISNGNAFCGIEWMTRCREAAIPYVSLAQANFEQLGAGDDTVDEVLKAYLGAKRAYFVSEGNRQLFERQVGISLTHAEVVRNPFNVSWDAAPAWPDETAKIHLACVGRLEPGAKGQDLLIEVLGMPKWRERPIQCTFFGKGPSEKVLGRLAAREGIAERIRFGGHVEDIQEVWRTHHALVLPSRYEGLPLSLVEAMLCGRPVITTDVAGNAELLVENETGFIADAPTAKHLDEAMERAWQRRDEWQEMGKKAAVAVRKQIPSDPARVFGDLLLKVAVEG